MQCKTSDASSVTATAVRAARAAADTLSSSEAACSHPWTSEAGSGGRTAPNFAHHGGAQRPPAVRADTNRSGAPTRYRALSALCAEQVLCHSSQQLNRRCLVLQARRCAARCLHRCVHLLFDALQCCAHALRSLVHSASAVYPAWCRILTSLWSLQGTPSLQQVLLQGPKASSGSLHRCGGRARRAACRGARSGGAADGCARGWQGARGCRCSAALDRDAEATQAAA